MAVSRRLTDPPPREFTLSDEDLARLAVSEARMAVRNLEELGEKPTDALRRRAAGDPERVAAFVARYSRSRNHEAT